MPFEQDSPLPHPPQLKVPPQPSLCRPHSAPRDWQEAGVQLGGGGGAQTLFEHVSPPLQLPQLKVPPQPSLRRPHSAPRDRQEAGVQPGAGGGGAGATQTPTEQVSPPLQLPQLTIPPHPSPHCAHSTPKLWQVAGVQAGGGGAFGGTSVQMPAKHSCPPLQLPQLMIPPHPSDQSPHSLPKDWQVAGVQAGGGGGEAFAGASMQVPLEHISPLPQTPQAKVPPQPS